MPSTSWLVLCRAEGVREANGTLSLFLHSHQSPPPPITSSVLQRSQSPPQSSAGTNHLLNPPQPPITFTATNHHLHSHQSSPSQPPITSSFAGRSVLHALLLRDDWWKRVSTARSPPQGRLVKAEGEELSGRWELSISEDWLQGTWSVHHRQPTRWFCSCFQAVPSASWILYFWAKSSRIFLLH